MKRSRVQGDCLHDFVLFPHFLGYGLEFNMAGNGLAQSCASSTKKSTPKGMDLSDCSDFVTSPGCDIQWA
jgi:hypothetical protein